MSLKYCMHNRKRIEDCSFCGKKRSNSPHHIIPKRYGGRETDENLLPVCRKCHDVLEEVLHRMIKGIDRFMGCQMELDKGIIKTTPINSEANK